MLSKLPAGFGQAFNFIRLFSIKVSFLFRQRFSFLSQRKEKGC